MNCLYCLERIATLGLTSPLLQLAHNQNIVLNFKHDFI